MSEQSRRTTLKGLAIGLPAAWSSPIVTTVILSAHAQTTGCGAPDGCYQVDFDGIDRSFFWPGGTGTETVNVFANTDCSGDPDASDTAVVAVDAEEATTALSCDDSVTDPSIVPSLSGGCGFFVCTFGPIND